MNAKQDSTVYAYLNSIDSGPLLTREQEEDLIKNVEVFQKEILNQLITSSFGRNELRAYLQSLESSGEPIVDISRKLDEESSKSDISEVESKFKLLIKELSKDNTDVIAMLLQDVCLSGTKVHGVVTEIKKKHSKIIDVESKFSSVRKYFNFESFQEIRNQVMSESDELKNRIKTEYGLTDIKVMNKLTEWKHIISEYEDVVKQLHDVTFEDVKDVYKSISNFELQASRFKNELITKNLRLVVSRAKKFLNKGLDFEDLIQEGNIGLMKAVDKFDSSKKTKVSTYATWWIDQSIRRAISNKGKTVRVPTHIEWMQTKLAQLVHKMTAELKREPTLKEISEKSGIALNVLEDVVTRAQYEVGLDKQTKTGKTVLESLPSEDESPVSIVERKILREKIREILSTLPPRTEKIIRLRFGIGEVPDDEGMTLQAIANQVGITKQGVRVIECSAFKVLKKKARSLSNG